MIYFGTVVSYDPDMLSYDVSCDDLSEPVKNCYIMYSRVTSYPVVGDKVLVFVTGQTIYNIIIEVFPFSDDFQMAYDSVIYANGEKLISGAQGSAITFYKDGILDISSKLSEIHFDSKKTQFKTSSGYFDFTTVDATSQESGLFSTVNISQNVADPTEKGLALGKVLKAPFTDPTKVIMLEKLIITDKLNLRFEKLGYSISLLDNTIEVKGKTGLPSLNINFTVPDIKLSVEPNSIDISSTGVSVASSRLTYNSSEVVNYLQLITLLDSLTLTLSSLITGLAASVVGPNVAVAATNLGTALATLNLYRVR